MVGDVRGQQLMSDGRWTIAAAAAVVVAVS